MACKKGCGNDANKIELIVKDLIRQMIEAGQLQEGLVDCSDRRLRRDNRVLACDQVKDAFCQMLDNGDICLVMPERILVKEDGKVCLLMSDGTENCSLNTLKDTKLQSYVIDGFTAKAIMSDGTDGPTLDLTDAFNSVSVGVKQNPDSSVTLSKPGKPDVTIPAINVRAEKASDGTITITNQDGSEVIVPPNKVRATTGDDGTITITNQDGSEVIVPPNKVRATTGDDGTITITNQDGSEVSIPPAPEPEPSASVELRGLFDEDVGFLHTAEETIND